jgi:RimJ/RimL family protein N-acetyltransferase
MKILDTERLTLRWFDERDAAFVLALVNDPAWILNIGDRGLRTPDDARAWIADKLVTSYWLRGHGLWAVERRADGVLVGMCGLVDRDSLPDIDVGYAIAAPFRRQGYAREATQATLAYARDVLGQRRIYGIVRPDNVSSIRVLEASGLASDGVRVLPGETFPSHVFTWEDRSTSPAADDEKSAIDALVRRFFAAFTNRGQIANVASLPMLFAPGAVVTVLRAGAPRGVETMSVRDFVTPRAALLQGGRLRDFEETEVASTTEMDGPLAHRTSRYRKLGMLDGARYEGGGRKHFQLVRSARGWRIAALVWQDDA